MAPNDKTLHSNLLIAKISDTVPERDKNRYLEVSRSWFIRKQRDLISFSASWQLIVILHFFTHGFSFKFTY